MNRPLQRWTRARDAAARLPIVMLIAGLASCSGVSFTGTETVETIYDRGLVAEGSKDGGMPLVVHGRPASEADRTKVVDWLMRGVRLPGWFDQQAVRAGTGQERYRLVLIFNPASLSDAANNPCGPLERIGTAAAEGRDTWIVSAFCVGDQPASRNLGKVNSAATGEHLVSQVNQLVTSMLPEVNPTLRGGEDLPI